MFCKSCGKELPDNAKFCSGCGTPVTAKDPEPPEEAAPVQPPVPGGESVPPAAGEGGAPRDELAAALDTAADTAVAVVPPPEVQTVPPVQGGGVPPVPPQKKGPPRIAVIAAAAAAAVVVAVLLVVLLLPRGGSKGTLVYLTDDDELMFRKDLKEKTEAVELTDEEAFGVRFSPDGKYLYFLEGDGDGNGDLYRVEAAKIGKKNVSPEKVSSDVNRYGITLLESGGALYVRGYSGDGQLRYYDGSESVRLANDVETGNYGVDEKEKFVYYTESDDMDGTLSLYRVPLGKDGEKERLLKDADVIYNYYDAEVLVYGKYDGGSDWEGEGVYDVYSTLPGGGEKVKLLSDVCAVLGVTVEGGKVDLTYLTSETETHTLYEFVSDSLASADAKETEPDQSDYQYQNAWGWWNTDWDAYGAAYDEWEVVANRNYIREELKNTEYEVTTYQLHRYNNGEETLLAGDLAFYPTYNMSAGVYLYAKSDQEIAAVCDVQDLEYWGEIYDRMGAASQAWYQNVGGVESPMDLEEESSVGDLYVLNGSEAVLTVHEDGDRLLQAYSIDKTGLTFLSTLADGGDDFANVSSGASGGKDALYYYVDVDSDGESGELMCYTGGKKTSIAKDAARVIVLADGAAFKMEDLSYNRDDIREGTLYLMKDGKGECIADDVAVSGMAFLSAKQVVYISDGDLYVWNGKESTKLASDVASLWLSGQAERRTYICS